MFKRGMLVISLLFTVCTLAAAQSAAQLQQQIPYYKAAQAIPGLTYDQYIRAINQIANENAANSRTSPSVVPTPTYVPPTVYVPPVTFNTNQVAPDNRYLGTLSANPYLPGSISNPYGQHGSPYSASSITNPYSPYGSPYSSTSVTNPYTTNAPNIVARDGQYLGKLSANPYDPNSISNPYGQYGSPYSPTSINNPYGIYGSPYSQLSPNNPYATQAPLIIAPRR
jgi:hypothetical protein